MTRREREAAAQARTGLRPLTEEELDQPLEERAIVKIHTFLVRDLTAADRLTLLRLLLEEVGRDLRARDQ